MRQFTPIALIVFKVDRPLAYRALQRSISEPGERFKAGRDRPWQEQARQITARNLLAQSELGFLLQKTKEAANWYRH